MRKTLRSPEHARFVTLLVKGPAKAGLTQVELADRLGRPQSFVAKYENGERRIDVIEFVELAKALGADPARLFQKLVSGAPTSSRASSRKS